MNKVIICDLDGTLLVKEDQFSPGTLEKIKRFINSGGKFIIATGRLDHDVVYVEEKLGIRGAYRISQNGAVIKNKYNEVISKKEMEPVIAKKIVKLLNEEKMRVEVSDICHRYFPSPRGEGEIAEFIDSSIIDSNFNEKIGKSIFPTTLLTFGSEKVFAQITKRIYKHFSHEVDVIETSPSTLEVLSKGASKGTAVEKVMKELQVSHTEVCSIGDAENDISMFGVTGYAYAVSSANAKVKAIVDKVYPTVGDCICAFMANKPGIR